jgi:hypothetical protein
VGKTMVNFGYLLIGYLLVGTRQLSAFLRRHAADLCLILCIGLSAVKLLDGIGTIVDIVLSDESYYLHNGVNLPNEGFSTAEWAPFYAIWYWLIAHLEPSHDPVNLYFFNHILLVGLTAMLMYGALRSLHCHQSLSAIAAFTYLISGIPVIWPRPTHFALVIVLLLLIGQRYIKQTMDFYYSLGLVCLAVAFVRPEYFLSFVLVSAAIGMVTVRRALFSSNSSTLRSSWALSFTEPKLLIYGSIAIALLSYLGIPTSAGNRSWWAFASHYALRWSWQHPTALNPWNDYQQIASFTFGNADTILEALLANPGAFWANSLENLKGYGENTIAILENSLRDFSPSLRDLSPLIDTLLRNSLMILLIVAIGQIIVQFALQRRQLASFFNSQPWRRLVILLCLVELSVLPACVLIFPRYHYLVIHGVLLAAVLIVLLSQVLPPTHWNLGFRQAAIAGTLMLLLTPTLAKGWCVGSICAFPRQDFPPRPNLETIQFVRSLHLKPPRDHPINTLAFDIEYRTYLGKNYRRIDPGDKQVGFSQFLAQQNIDLIIVSPELNQDIRLVNDPQWKAFLQNYTTANYQQFNIPNTKRRLLVHKRL